MITDIVFFVMGSVLFMLSKLLSVIPYLIPSSTISTAVALYAGYLHYAQGVLPIIPNPSGTGLWQTVGFLTIFGWGIDFIVAWYTLKLVLWVFAMLPFVGRHVPLPSGASAGGEVHVIGPTEQIGGISGYASFEKRGDAFIRRKE